MLTKVGQLRKMGILETDEKKVTVASPATRRKSGLDFGSLKPLNAAGTKNFGGYRDMQSPKAKKKSEDAMDSDADDEDDQKPVEADDDKDVIDKGMLSPEDAAKQGELAEGVRKIKVSIQMSTSSTFTNTIQAEATALRRAPARSACRRIVVRISCLRLTCPRQLESRGIRICHCYRGCGSQHRITIQEAPCFSARL